MDDGSGRGPASGIDDGPGRGSTSGIDDRSGRGPKPRMEDGTRRGLTLVTVDGSGMRPRVGMGEGTGRCPKPREDDRTGRGCSNCINDSHANGSVSSGRGSMPVIDELQDESKNVDGNDEFSTGSVVATGEVHTVTISEADCSARSASMSRADVAPAWYTLLGVEVYIGS